LRSNIKNILTSYGYKDKEQNVYIHLYHSIKKAIENRILVEKSKLPPSRVLAQDLEISRSTVIKAYDLLVLEKYAKAIPGSGIYVAQIKNIKVHNNLHSEKSKYPHISKRGIAFKKNTQIVNKKSKTGIAFRPGLPPLDIFPISQWQNLSNNYWKTIKPSELSYSSTIGLNCLRENISNYLKVYRNIKCEVNQIIITTGTLHSLYLIANALINKNDEVVLENPTYPLAYNLFNSLKAKIHYGNIDKEGVTVDKIKCKKPKLIYTTPSNQYPSGVKMSLKRRLELLKWASRKKTFIIEDDYDHEFSNWENPVASIYSLDYQERVIYLGAFNKILHPSLRLGYMIVPHYLLDTITALIEQSSRFVPPSLQKTLSSFIEKDYLNRHLRNVIDTSIARKEIFIKHFTDKLSKEFKLESNPLGLHIIAKLNQPISDELISSALAKKNIIASPYSKYFIGNSFDSGLVMGYASVNEKNIMKKIDVMQQLLKNPLFLIFLSLIS